MTFNLLKIFNRKSSSPDYANTQRRWFWSKSSAKVNEDSAMQVAAFNRGLIYISTQIAKLPWDVKDRDNVVMEGGISNLLNLSANKEINAFRFRLVMIQQAIIHGNAYAEIERSVNGTPLALWPIPSCDVEAARSTDGDLFYKVSGQSAKYGSVYLPARDVFHLPNFHTKDGVNGMGIVQYGAETLGISLAADQMASGIFLNGGIPSGVIQTKGKMNDEAYARLKKSWDEQHGGRKTGGTAILEEGAEYHALNIPPEALQFLESRKFSVLDVARFLGVPPTKLFDITAATYSNVENSNLEVATDTLDAWVVNLEMEADVKILNNRFGGRFTEMDLYSVFRGDMKTRSDYFKSLMSVGAITPNQIRRREGLAPYKGGDEYYIATNNFTPASRVNDVIDAQIAKKTEPPKEVNTENKDNAIEEDLSRAAIHYLNSGK